MTVVKKAMLFLLENVYYTILFLGAAEVISYMIEGRWVNLLDVLVAEYVLMYIGMFFATHCINKGYLALRDGFKQAKEEN